MKPFAKIDRRDFLKSSAAIGGGLLIGFYLPPKGEAAGEADTLFEPNAFLGIDEKGVVTVWVGRAEMGQGVLTSVPMLLAEELEADWSRIRVEMAPADGKYGDMVTGGSRSIMGSWDPLRAAGATAREMLLEAAARRWLVPKKQCHAEAGYVVHRTGKARASFGDLAAAAAELPVPEDPPLKKPGEFALIGTSPPKTDTRAKVKGTARFGSDVMLPGMFVAAVRRCPIYGGTVRSFDDSEAIKSPGVRKIVPLEYGVAVVADTTWNALKGRDLLRVEWDEGENGGLGGETIARLFDEGERGAAATAREEGDVDAAWSRSGPRLDAVYEVPFLSHSPMEPMTCTASVEGEKCTIWVPSQSPIWAKHAAARAIDVPPENVTVYSTYLGGGFGRRLMNDFASEAALVSKAAGAPVKVFWTRADDMGHDYYRPASRHILSAGLDAAGNPVAWTHRVVAPSIGYQFNAKAIDEAGGLDEGAVRGASNIPYSIPNIRVEYALVKTSIPLGWWRSVYDNQNAFANECFIDEVAEAAGKDPVDFRISLLDKEPRLRRVLQVAATWGGWGKTPPSGRARGVACHFCFGSYVAYVAEVSLRSDGTPAVHRVVCAVDCGQVVHPDTVKAQMEGAVAFALSAAVRGKITFAAGRAEQENFDDEEPLRMREMPEVEVHLVPSGDPVGGIGEPGIPPLAPAVVNAFSRLTGMRTRRLPLVDST